MYLFSLLLPLTTLFLLARADPPFPIITKPYPPAVSTKVASDVSVYLTSAAAQPAYTSVLIAFASEAPELASSLVSGPLVLGVMFFTATATPTWYPQLPSDVQVCFMFPGWRLSFGIFGRLMCGIVVVCFFGGCCAG